MLGVNLNLSVWGRNREAEYNRLRPEGYGAFLTEAQQCRVERIRQGQMLFDGCHRRYFLDEGRTQYHFAEALVNGVLSRPYSEFNVLGLTSLKFADLLFGQPPVLTVDDAVQQSRLDDLVKRCNLGAFLHGCAVDASYEAESFIESVIHDDGRVYLQQVPAIEIFPEGELQPDGQYASYVRYCVRNKGTKDAPVWVLLEVRYRAGSIERRLRQLDRSGRPMNMADLDLAVWDTPPGATSPPAGARPLEPVTRTGIARNTITYVPNATTRRVAASDYDGAIGLQDKLNARDTQVDNILSKHADPMVAVPEEVNDGQGNARAQMKVYFYQDPERVPKYVVRDLQLESAFTDARRTLTNLCIRLEMSPVLLGMKEGAAPDAWRKVKLESFNTIKKAERKAQYWTPGVTRAVEVAQDLESTIPGVRYDRYPISVEIRDGIPQDSLDLATELTTLKTGGLLSRKRGLMRLYGDPTAVAAEDQEISAEEAAAAPATFGGLGLSPAGAEPGEDAATPAAASDASGSPAAAAAGNDLRSTVGALTAIQDLQEAYYGKKLPREACIANATLMLGFSEDEAGELFPEVKPDAPTDGAAAAKATTQAPPLAGGQQESTHAA